ncbi:unnamed protein product [Didymodactylos carnosus]|nr:unnamed protein product [Didymodactylos carnosus]CAF4290221.1 unnamed protein product [Didymodactylos carnosus]
MMGVINRTFRYAPFKLKRHLYTTCVRPVLYYWPVEAYTIEYASTVFDSSYKTHLEPLNKVQRVASRIICGDFTSSSSSSRVACETQLEPFECRRKIARPKYFWKVMRERTALARFGLLQPMTDRRTLRKGNSRMFSVPECKKDVLKETFLEQ